jgi:hypothetical protein
VTGVWNKHPENRGSIPNSRKRSIPRKNLSPFGTEGGGVYPRIKRPGRASDHSTLSSAEFENKWNYTSILSYSFIAYMATSASLYFRNLDASFSIQWFVFRTKAVNVSFAVEKCDIWTTLSQDTLIFLGPLSLQQYSVASFIVVDLNRPI